MPYSCFNLIELEDVDIYKRPNADFPLKAGEELTIGDLHANAMKLLFMLVKHGIALNVTKAHYEYFDHTYSMAVAGLFSNFGSFNKVLEEIEFKPHMKIRLIGDELADRGANDYFILKILERLKLAKVEVEILVSNHGYDFIRELEEDTLDKDSAVLMGPTTSKDNLKVLIKAKPEILAEVEKIAKNAYLPTLKLISYSLREDEKEIIIYTHAGVGLITIKKMADKLDVSFNYNTAKDLAKTIDTINQVFQEKHVASGKVTTLSDSTRITRSRPLISPSSLPSSSNENVENVEGEKARCAFDLLIWNRKSPVKELESAIKDYKLIFVHGHNMTSIKITDVYNLDNILGKMDKVDSHYCHNSKGKYTVFHCPNTSSLQPKPNERLVTHSKPENQSASSQLSPENPSMQVLEFVRTGNRDFLQKLLNQSTSINLNVVPADPSIQGTTLAWWIARAGHWDLLKQLIKVSGSIIDLNAAPTQTDHNSYGITLAWRMARTQEIDLLGQVISQSKSTVDLNAAPTKKAHQDQGTTLAWWLARNGQIDLLEKLIDQSKSIVDLNAAPTQETHQDQGMSLFLLIVLYKNQNSKFWEAYIKQNATMIDLNATMIKKQPEVNLAALLVKKDISLLKAIMQKQPQKISLNNVLEGGITLAFVLARRKEFKFLEELMEKHFIDLNVTINVPDHPDHGMTFEQLLQKENQFLLLGKIKAQKQTKATSSATLTPEESAESSSSFFSATKQKSDEEKQSLKSAYPRYRP